MVSHLIRGISITYWNFQESTTISNACTKNLKIYWMHHVYIYIYFYMCVCVCVCVKDLIGCWEDTEKGVCRRNLMRIRLVDWDKKQSLYRLWWLEYMQVGVCVFVCAYVAFIFNVSWICLCPWITKPNSKLLFFFHITGHWRVEK